MRDQSGFVLATTVWMLAVLMLLAGLFHNYVQQELQRAVLTKKNSEAEIDILSTENTVRYLLLSRHFTYAGLTTEARESDTLFAAGNYARRLPYGDEIALDSTVYSGVGCAMFRIQDSTGLIGLNAIGADSLLSDTLSWQLGDQKLRSLSATLADYIDKDEQRRVGGAERFEYERYQLVPPANDFLRSDREIERIYGWTEWLTRNPSWRDLLNMGFSSAFNINTAPPALLALLLDIELIEAQELVDHRRTSPFSSLKEVAKVLSRVDRWQTQRFRFYADGSFKLQFWCAENSYTKSLGLQLTPQSLNGPEQIDYVYRGSGASAKSTPPAAIPSQTTLFADSLSTDGG
ncbi:MAG: type II secretion system protein GspK [Pseudomonadota bacterium]